MKVISFNANGIRSAARKGFFDWFKYQDPDFLCIQETRVNCKQIASNRLFFPKGYHYSYTNSNKLGYSGVAIYSKRKPNNIIHKLGIDWADEEGRYIQFDYNNLSIASIYFPSGSSSELRQLRKMDFLDKYKTILKQQISQNKPFIICGDFNIIHKEIDIKNWKSNQKNSGVLPEERAWLDYIFNNIGWIDAFRVINKYPENYTWWSNRGKARERNVGWRIDYQCISPNLKHKVSTEEIYTDEKFSDHAPLIITYSNN